MQITVDALIAEVRPAVNACEQILGRRRAGETVSVADSKTLSAVRRAGRATSLLTPEAADMVWQKAAYKAHLFAVDHEDVVREVLREYYGLDASKTPPPLSEMFLSANNGLRSDRWTPWPHMNRRHFQHQRVVALFEHEAVRQLSGSKEVLESLNRVFVLVQGPASAAEAAERLSGPAPAVVARMICTVATLVEGNSVHEMGDPLFEVALEAATVVSNSVGHQLG